jgi:YD repeat-containing protein
MMSSWARAAQQKPAVWSTYRRQTAEVWLDLWGGTSGTFTGLDLFGRIIDQRWQNNVSVTPADIDRYQYTYDQNSNRLTRTNTLNTGLNETYTYDMLNRLTLATPLASFAQQWVLDSTGNWSNFREGPGGGTLLQVRTANTVNEYTAITGTAGPAQNSPITWKWSWLGGPV